MAGLVFLSFLVLSKDFSSPFSPILNQEIGFGAVFDFFPGPSSAPTDEARCLAGFWVVWGGSCGGVLKLTISRDFGRFSSPFLSILDLETGSGSGFRFFPTP